MTTKSADIGEVKAWIAEAIRAAMKDEQERACRLLGKDIAYAMEHTNDPHCTERGVWARYAQRLTDLAAAIRAGGMSARDTAPITAEDVSRWGADHGRPDGPRSES